MDYVVVVPVYKETPSTEEKYALLQLRRLAIRNIVLVCPSNLNTMQYQNLLPGVLISPFDSIHFQNLHQYNRLVSSISFYKRFADSYQYLLMYQLDAFLFDDRIEYFCNLGYDYYGAPWKDGVASPLFLFNRKLLKSWGPRFYVGNGGLSLRKLSSTIDLLIRKKNHVSHELFLEDLFFGYWGTHDPLFRACPENIAVTFSLETNPRYWVSKHKSVPMGVHAALKWDPDFYFSLLKPHYDQIDRAYSDLCGFIA